MRIAWFSPVPPEQSGISAYAGEILPRLATRHEVDLVLDESAWRHWAAGEPAAQRPAPTEFARVHPFGPGIHAYRAHDFTFIHHHTPYDVIVYQLGNATCHDYMWPYAMRYPGLVVFHDGHVHHARARALLLHGRRDDYRAEFAWSHPDAPRDAAEYAVAGMTGASYYFFRWLRPLVARARALAAHTPALCDVLGDIATALPRDTPAPSLIRMGVADLAPPTVATRPGDRPVTIAAFGLITEEKRLVPLLRALAAVRDRCGARVVLVGARAPHFDIDSIVRTLGLGDVVEVTGYVDETALTQRLAEADVSICLRWPSTGETSASWLRCLAAGRATVVTDLCQTTQVPALDPRSWAPIDGGRVAADAGGRLARREPVCVAIDILDEEHSLRLALHRLCTDGSLRERLGTAARAWWADHHTLDVMESDYLAALELAAQAPMPEVPADFPAHLLADGTAEARRLLDHMHIGVDLW